MLRRAVALQQRVLVIALPLNLSTEIINRHFVWLGFEILLVRG